MRMFRRGWVQASSSANSMALPKAPKGDVHLRFHYFERMDSRSVCGQASRYFTWKTYMNLPAQASGYCPAIPSCGNCLRILGARRSRELRAEGA